MTEVFGLRMRFAFTTVLVSDYCRSHGGGFEGLLNDFGKNGWDIAHVHYSNDLPYQVIFKKAL